MKCNLHTHTLFCDGKNSPDEMVRAAIGKGLCSLGFSGHGYTSFDNSFCMTDTEGYIKEVLRVKEKYKDKIQIFLGLEEDCEEPCDRKHYDYIIGSCHYYNKDGKRFDVDGSAEITMEAFAAFDNNVTLLAENYYKRFCDYILERKPDIIGHFDLLTKFDEVETPLFLGNREYEAVSEKYLLCAMKSNCFFEVNTGAISRGYRKTPYPEERLLYLLNKNGAKIVITSDCHSTEGIDCFYDETVCLLREVGFKHTYIYLDNEFKKSDL